MPPLAKRRILQRVGLGLLGLIATYYLGLHALLNLGILSRTISDHPSSMMMSWKSAWSPWPGRVFVRGYYLRAQDPDRQWELVVDKAETQVVLSQLLHRTFQSSFTRAQGVEFRMRPKQPRGSPESLLLPYPPIRGFSEAIEESVRPPEDPQDPKGWAARLENVSVKEVRELWIAAYRGALDAEVTEGRIWVRPQYFLDVGPATLQIRSADVFLARTPVASGLKGQVDFGLDVRDLAEPGELAIFAGISGRAQLKGTLSSIAFLGYHLPIEPEGGEGRLSLDLAVEHGHLGDGSRIDVDGKEALARVGEYHLRGIWGLHGGVSTQGGHPHARLEVGMHPFHLVNGRGERMFESAGATATLSAGDFVLGVAPQDGALAFELSPTDSFPLRRMNTLVAGGPFMIDSGRAVLAGHLFLGPGSPKKGGALTLHASRVRATLGRLQLQGEAVATLDLAHLKVGRETADISGSSISLSNVAVLGSETRPGGWNGKLSIDQATVALRPEMKFHADVSGVFSDARPFLTIIAGGLPSWAMPLFEAAGLHAKCHLALEGGAVVVKDLVADGQGLSIRGQLEATERSVNGQFLVKVKGFPVALDIRDGVPDQHVINAEGWYRERIALTQPKR